jgi:glycosyltransferase involved in cell wall biosynthesis
VRKVLLVAPSLAYGGAARQLTLLAAALPRQGFDVRVAVLGRPSPWAEQLRAAGLLVHVLGRHRPFDVRPFLELRGVVRAVRPGAVHVWGAAALRAVVLSGAAAPGRLTVSAALPSAGPPPWLDRWLLRRAGRVAALGQAEAERYRRLGVAGERLTALGPAVAPAPACAPAEAPGLPADARVVLAVGPVARHKGFRQAVWAFDILAHALPDLHLAVAGDGPDLPAVRAFARAIRVEPRVHFLGPVNDLGPWRARAELVWVPSLAEAGHGSALEAMAAGKPVVASRLPGLAELVVEGQTGLLARPDDKAELARQTHVLLKDADLGRRLGTAGRQRAAQFSAARLAEGAARLYEAATTGRSSSS